MFRRLAALVSGLAVAATAVASWLLGHDRYRGRHRSDLHRRTVPLRTAGMPRAEVLGWCM